MTQMGLLCWPKHTSTTTCGGASSNAIIPTNTNTTTTTSGSRAHGSNSPNYYSCSCLSKLLRKLKNRSRMLHGTAPPSRQSSFQCHYDPLSYALNFDATGCGTSSEDDDPDYHRFYAFSSRFVATPKAACSAAASH